MGDRPPILMEIQMARYKKDEREHAMKETRELLLEAAADEFSRQGYLGANINQISLSAGFAKGTVYNYFPSKQALMLALIDAVAGFHLEFIKDRVLLSVNADQRLAHFFQSGFAFVSEHPSKARAMFNVIYGPDDELKNYIFNAYQPMFQFVEQDILSTGIQTGNFRQIDVLSVTNLLMTIYLGTASQISEDGHFWQDPLKVADLVLNGLSR